MTLALFLTELVRVERTYPPSHLDDSTGVCTQITSGPFRSDAFLDLSNIPRHGVGCARSCR